METRLVVSMNPRKENIFCLFVCLFASLHTLQKSKIRVEKYIYYRHSGEEAFGETIGLPYYKDATCKV